MIVQNMHGRPPLSAIFGSHVRHRFLATRMEIRNKIFQQDISQPEGREDKDLIEQIKRKS
jgi:hypothetical protein